MTSLYLLDHVCKTESQARQEREWWLPPHVEGVGGSGEPVEISQTSRAIGSAFAWGLLGSQDNYLNAGGIMESRQDFNQFHI